MKGIEFLFFIASSLAQTQPQNDISDINDEEILDRINIGGKCYHPDNMLFYPIRNTALIDADSVVFDFIGAINHTLMCCMFDQTRFVNSFDRKIRKCTRKTPEQIQRVYGVRCCKFYHRITYRWGFDTYVIKDYKSGTSETWETSTTLTARITSEQVKTALEKGQMGGDPYEVVYDSYFQLHYPTGFESVEKRIRAPSEPGKATISSKVWQLVNGLPDVYISASSSTVVPGVVLKCSVSNATTPRIRLYPSVKPNYIFRRHCHFHTMRIRSHEPRASKLKNSRASYPHFSLPQMATYVKAYSWSTFPKCAFNLGRLGTVSVTAHCRTSVFKSQAYVDAWSANSVQLTLYNPSVEIKSKKVTFYFIDEVELGFLFSETIDSPYNLETSIPSSSRHAIFRIPDKLATFSFHYSAAPGIYHIETTVTPKLIASSSFVQGNDLIFRNSLTINLQPLEPIVEPFAKIHYIYEIVHCKANVDQEVKLERYLRWDVGNLAPEVRSKFVIQDNGSAFVFIGTIPQKYQPLTFYCRLGSRPSNMKSVKHTFKISGKPNLRLQPSQPKYYTNELVTCETDRKSYGHVILRPIDLCKDEGHWCNEEVRSELKRRNSTDSFAFPMHLKEKEYLIECMILPRNSTGNLAKKTFTVQYDGLKMMLSPNRKHHGFNTEISCIFEQHKDRDIYFEFPLKWVEFIHVTKTGSFVVSDLPVPGYMTFFCGLKGLKRKAGKNVTIFIGDENFGRFNTRNNQSREGRRLEFYTYALFVGCLNNLMILYIAFAINFLIRIHETKKTCVKRFIEKYNIDEAVPEIFNDLLSFACDEDLLRNAPETRHLYSTN